LGRPLGQAGPGRAGGRAGEWADRHG